MSFGLDEHHVLVTGGSGGIGRVAVRQYLEQGAFVTLQYATEKGLEKLKAADESLLSHERVFIVKADAKDEESVAQCFAQASNRFGPVTVLVANHGIFPPDDVKIQDMSVAQFQNTLTVNLTGIFIFAREWVRGLVKAMESAAGAQKERIERANCVIVGSTSGIFGEAGHIDYSCSKSALTYGFMRSLKNEIVHIVPHGRVNVIAPGWVLTDMAQAAIDKDPQVVDKAVQTVAMRKIASPDDVASGILVLSSPKLSGHVSGTVLECTGGMEGRCLHRLG